MKASSNTSTLIRFYRASPLAERLKELYDEGILIPDFCWEELMRRRELPENQRMLKDESVFLMVVKPSSSEMKRAVDLIDFAYEYASLQLDMEEAVAISIGEFRNAEDTLSDDYVALALPNLTELRISILSSLDVLAKMVEEKVLEARDPTEFRDIVVKFERECKEKFSRKKLDKLIRKLYS